MEEQKQTKGNGMATASLVLGIITLLFYLLPLLNGWFFALAWISWITGILALIFGIIAIVKGQRAKAIAGIVITIISFFIPRMFASQYAASVNQVKEDTALLQEKVEAMEAENQAAEVTEMEVEEEPAEETEEVVEE